MKTILKKVEKYKDTTMRFHTPGQSFNIADELYSNNKYDITELSFSDNLLYPNGELLQLEKQLEKIYNTSRTLVITAGATVGNFIGLNVLKTLGKVLICRGCHKSIYSGVKLFNVDCIFMDNKDEDFVSPVTYSEIESYLKKDSDIKSVVITSPTYFGNVVKTEDVKRLQQQGIVVMADEAHGSHFVYSSLLPDSLACVCDITIDSVHKTLPVYTGGALIHVKNNNLVAQTEFYHSLLHSSSPNYVTMCSIDYSQDLFSQDGERLYKKLYDKVTKLKLNKFKVVKTDDFSRLVIDTMPYDASSVLKQLEKKGVFIEMSYKHYLVFILSPLNVDSFEKAVKILQQVEENVNDNNTLLYKKEVTNNKAEKIEDVANYKVELTAICDAENKISAGEVGVYPPGIPLIKSGEKITSDMVEFMLQNKDKLFGQIDGKIYTIKK